MVLGNDINVQASFIATNIHGLFH